MSKDLTLRSNTFTIGDIIEANPKLDHYSLGQDFMIFESSATQTDPLSIPLDAMKYPFRFDGFVCMYCERGDYSLEVNMKSFDIHTHSIFTIIPGSIVRFTPVGREGREEFRFICILTSREFMHNIRFDYSKSFQDSIRILRTPVISLNDHQRCIVEDYLSLADKIIHSPLTRRKEVIGSLISSLAYTIADVWQEKLSLAVPEDELKKDRLSALFDRFITLVGKHCTQVRTVGFYAEKLCLTPKYLSKLIKQTSGRSAPDWIDSFVILEAKNLLRYSHISIKEIVSMLNFPNQSVFYKFFKAHAGMTPLEYRKDNR